MTVRSRTLAAAAALIASFAAASALSPGLAAQDRLKKMPGYERFQRMSKEIPGAVKSGALAVSWKDGGRAFEYVLDGRLFRYDVRTLKATDVGPAPDAPGRVPGRRPAGPARGRQAETATSPDGKLTAVHRDRNLYLTGANGGSEATVTTDGSEVERIKYGTASWVYGEELRQTTAMWWSPDSTKLAYYRFDEKEVPDYHLQMEQTKLYSAVDTEAYPKAGEPNPVVELFVYDVATRQSTRIDVRDGRPFDDGAVGHYVYRVSWSPDGRELLFHRTNRKQNILEFVAANPTTGACRVILREEWPTGWVENSPFLHLLEDGRRFIWLSERNGWRNYYLYDLSGKLLNPITAYSGFEAGSLVKVDEEKSLVFLMARDGDNHMKLQLHRVGLDGKGDVRLTDAAFNHAVGSCLASGGRPQQVPGGVDACGISPDNRFFVDVYQTHEKPAATRLVDAATGKVVAEILASDMSRFDELGLKKAEMFTYKAADGVTELHGLISFPSDFDPGRKYPALVAVYGGPASASNTARETFVTPSPLTEYGFLVVNLSSRAAPGRGKRTLDSIYMKLGQVEMDDMAEGVRALGGRPYFDSSSVGIYGTSYGGYSSLMCLLRHPDLFHAASASSAVTAWYHYDTIYTERYMWTPQENREGYEAGDAVRYVEKLAGRLLVYYGTADNNVHPSNSMQLIQALQKAGKSFEVQVGPDLGHSGVNQQRMMEFFIENLVVNPQRAGS